MQFYYRKLPYNKVTVAVVEYTKKRVYLGVQDDGFLTYCKAPIGKVNQNLAIPHFHENTVTLNEKDRQKFVDNEKKILNLQFFMFNQ